MKRIEAQGDGLDWRKIDVLSNGEVSFWDGSSFC